MLRKQGLAAPVSARPDLPERSPALAVRRNRRTFTLADQVNLLVSAREADPDRGFLGRTMGATIRRCVNSIGGEYPSGLI